MLKKAAKTLAKVTKVHAKAAKKISKVAKKTKSLTGSKKLSAKGHKQIITNAKAKTTRALHKALASLSS